jgi:CRP/FNR family transcriptional regulator, dissimilatory nitrate respiration regulator
LEAKIATLKSKTEELAISERARLTADWLSDSVGASSIERELKAGQTLFRSGNRTAGLYQVVKGKVHLVRIDRAGREAVLQVAAAGDRMAEASLFSPTYHCDAVATTEAAVRLYPRAAILAEFERNSKAAQAFMAMLAGQVMNLRTRLEQRNIHSARDRVRHYLMLNAVRTGVPSWCQARSKTSQPSSD